MMVIMMSGFVIICSCAVLASDFLQKTPVSWEGAG